MDRDQSIAELLLEMTYRELGLFASTLFSSLPDAAQTGMTEEELRDALVMAADAIMEAATERG